jgi:hypothetical protein
MNPRQYLHGAGTMVLLASLSACAGGPGPDLLGPRGPDLMAAYSGDWVLLRLESDDLAGKILEAQAGQPRPGSTGARPGGGMTGGRPGGGMTGGRPGGGARPGGVAGGMDPEALQQALVTVRALSEVPARMTLTLTPAEVELAPDGSPAITLGLGAREERFQQGRAAFVAAAKWTRKGLVVERAGERAGRVKDEISVDREGRLVVNRQVDLPARGTVKGTLRYARQTPEG